ncbi:hypothetical protein BH23GEM6_BH23GEM6_02220 [soil metagenome]
MQHLNLEELARYVDEAPAAAAAFHLSSCSHCAEELEALRFQTRALSELSDLPSRGGQWPAMRERLVAENLLVRPSDTRRQSRTWLIRTAAAIALFLTGAASGALLRGGPFDGDRQATPSTALEWTPAGVGAVTSAEAGEQLREAEHLYLAALTRYAELTQGGTEIDPLNRLAALEGIVLTAQAALREAPADPVINGYLLTAMGQRNAMLREISRSSTDTWY